jgi:hypothetical protein
VVAVEMNGEIAVEQTRAAMTRPGVVTLPSEAADHFYNNNGEGYYDPPVLRKLRWTFDVARGGGYRVEITYRPGRFSRRVDVTVGDQLLRASVQGEEKSLLLPDTVALETGSQVTLTVEPGAPRERAAALGFEPIAVRLTRIAEMH